MTTEKKLQKIIESLGSKEAVAARLNATVQTINNYLGGSGSGIGRVAIDLLWQSVQSQGNHSTDQRPRSAPDAPGVRAIE